MKINVSKKVYQKIKEGYLWIFDNELKNFPSVDSGFVDLYHNGIFVGKAYYNSESKISFRMVSFRNEQIDLNFWVSRLKELYYQKSKLYDSNFRWVYSEGDFLPGLIIDFFTTIEGKKVAVCMLLTKGVDSQQENIFKALVKLGVDCIINRSDSNLRKLEGLEPKREITYGSVNLPFTVKIDDILFLIDPLNGQKTGFYFDQTENRRFLKNIAKDKVVLDVFSYIGSFSLYALKYGARFVEMIDESNFAYNIVPQLMKLNNFQNRYLFHEGNAFEKLRELAEFSKRFSIVIVDPPSFVKTKDKIQNALKAYFDVNYRALKLVENNGYFLTSSCSQKVTEEKFLDVVRQAFFKEGVHGKLIYRGGQAMDHPVNLAMPETQYLKFLAFQVQRL